MCRRNLWPVCVLVSVSMCLSCGGRKTASGAATVDNEKPKVAVIVRKSEFKSRLVERITDDYGEKTQLTFMDIAQLNDVNEDAFDALVVMGARMGFLLFNVKERRFLRKLNHKEKLVFVMTAAAADWKWDRNDVDVISGASRIEDLDPIYEAVNKRLDAILTHRPMSE
jgi:hypothetical protein